MYPTSKVLKIPPNVEWLKISGVTNCKFDISECDKIIAMNIERGVKYDDITWPKSNKNIIPYVQIQVDEYSVSRYHPLPNIRVLQVFGNHKREGKMYQTMREVINKLKANKGGYDCNNNIDLICLKLRDKRNLLSQLMDYKYDSDIKSKNEKISQVQRWWTLKSALWIQRLDDYIPHPTANYY